MVIVGDILQFLRNKFMKWNIIFYVMLWC